MPFTVDLKGCSDKSAETIVVKRPEAVSHTAEALRRAASGTAPCDERPTDPAPPVHSFRLPKFPKDPGLPDVARLYEEALSYVRAREANEVPGHSTFRPAPVLRHRYRPARLPARNAGD
jgi:hypothetical protein